jgi:hypothetical protein
MNTTLWQKIASKLSVLQPTILLITQIEERVIIDRSKKTLHPQLFLFPSLRPILQHHHIDRIELTIAIKICRINSTLRCGVG